MTIFIVVGVPWVSMPTLTSLKKCFIISMYSEFKVTTTLQKKNDEVSLTIGFRKVKLERKLKKKTLKKNYWIIDYVSSKL
jgi:hypothetical protein